MKIALQISGRLRFTDASVRSLLGAIIEQYEPDVFCSFWEPINSYTVSEYIKYVNPTLIEIENQNLVKPYLDNLFPYNVHVNMPSMMYKFDRVSKLRIAYELSKNMRYSHIIQARTDNLFFEKLTHKFTNDKGIWCSNNSKTPDIDNYISPRMVDNFYLGDSNSIDTAANCFWQLKAQAESYTQRNMLHHVRIPEIIQSQLWLNNNISIHSLAGTSPAGNFWYDIDRNETQWK